MKQIDPNILSRNITSKFGLPVSAQLTYNQIGPQLLLEPEGVYKNEAFQICVIVGWRSLHLEFIPGKFSADLISEMGKSSTENMALFSSIVKEMMKEKVEIDFQINSTICDPLAFEKWPSTWRRFSFSVKKTGIEVNTDDKELTLTLINKWIERFFAATIALMPIEEQFESSDAEGLPEGAKTQATVNRYERSKYNRAICINFHGLSCKVCETDLVQVYGAIADGFIHVHHIIPVSVLGEDYIVDPIKDLVPVCPNCHSMLHRRTPPLSIEELREHLIRKYR